MLTCLTILTFPFTNVSGSVFLSNEYFVYSDSLLSKYGNNQNLMIFAVGVAVALTIFLRFMVK